MDNSIPVWLLPLLSFAVGVIATLLISRMMRSEASDTPDKRINDLQKRFDSYQDEVVAHFSTTAELVNKLTENYQNVQEHLLQSAERLALDEATRQRLLNSLVDTRALEHARQAPVTAPEPAATPAPAPAEQAAASEPDTIPEPPRDYASKEEGEVGTLDASYGLKKD
ncbi:MAG: DUF1043 family protein [Gammaproteobacteria bacterium]|nr:DUF1043 family protein [Gammaproteobacteria bacterium]